MTPERAREILLLYRPGSRDAEDADVIEAMAMARSDPALADWFKKHCAFQEAMRRQVRSIKVPLHLQSMLLAGARVPHLRPWWQRPAFRVATAASLALLVVVAGLWLRPRPKNVFENFQSRMVSNALRDYGMDIVTNDMAQVRAFLANNGAPADYEVAAGLQRLSLTGGGVLKWRDNPVSMVCFDRGDKQMLYLFVVNRAALKDPPPPKPRIERIYDDYVAASWSKGNKAYILAGPQESGIDKLL